MNLTIKILEVLREKGELTLEELFNLIPKKSNDHRDLYPLASLISLGYIEDDMLTPIEEKKKENIHLIAYKLYAWSTADHDFAEYKGNGEHLVLDLKTENLQLQVRAIYI